MMIKRMFTGRHEINDLYTGTNLEIIKEMQKQGKTATVQDRPDRQSAKQPASHWQAYAMSDQAAAPVVPFRTGTLL